MDTKENESITSEKENKNGCIDSNVDEFCNDFIGIMSASEYEFVNCQTYNMFTLMTDSYIKNENSSYCCKHTTPIKVPVFKGQNGRQDGYFYHSDSLDGENRSKIFGLYGERFKHLNNKYKKLEELNILLLENKINKSYDSVSLDLKIFLIFMYKYFEYNQRYFDVEQQVLNYIIFYKLFVPNSDGIDELFDEKILNGELKFQNFKVAFMDAFKNKFSSELSMWQNCQTLKLEMNCKDLNIDPEPFLRCFSCAYVETLKIINKIYKTNPDQELFKTINNIVHTI